MWRKKEEFQGMVYIADSLVVDPFFCAHTIVQLISYLELRKSVIILITIFLCWYLQRGGHFD
jgi:hypothetical protein